LAVKNYRGFNNLFIKVFPFQTEVY
jgi:hypothetical protein